MMLTTGLYGDVQASLSLSVHQEVVIGICKWSLLQKDVASSTCDVCHARLQGVDGEGACLQGQGPHTPPEPSLAGTMVKSVLQHTAVGDIDLQEPGVGRNVESASKYQ